MSTVDQFILIGVGSFCVVAAVAIAWAFFGWRGKRKGRPAMDEKRPTLTIPPYRSQPATVPAEIAVAKGDPLWIGYNPTGKTISVGSMGRQVVEFPCDLEAMAAALERKHPHEHA